jgi:hypothetical protein
LEYSLRNSAVVAAKLFEQLLTCHLNIVDLPSGTAVGENVGARCAHATSNKPTPHHTNHPTDLILSIPKVAAWAGLNATPIFKPG